MLQLTEEILPPGPELFCDCADLYSPVVIVSVCFSVYHVANTVSTRRRKFCECPPPSCLRSTASSES